MDVVSVFILVLSSVTATFGLIQLIFWFTDRTHTERLAFSLACFGSVCFAVLELEMARSETPEQYLFFHRIAHPFSALTIIGTAWFVYTSLGTGRRWLFWSIVGARIAILAIHLSLPNGINWAEVTAMVPVTILGGRYYYAQGIAQPTNLLPLFSFVLLFAFAIDTSIRAWRPGDRIRVTFYGFGAALFAIVTPGLAAGILFGFLRGPVFVATTILFVILAMSVEMLLEMQKAVGLSNSLKKSEANLSEALEQLHLSAEAGEVGLWRRSFDEPFFWANEKAKELFGFTTNARIGPREFLDQVHEDDRERVIETMKEIEKSGREFDIEFRIRTPDGVVRWVHSRGDIVQGEPMWVRGASVDVTKRKIAEQEVHELARKLIDAQEEERARFARDLHDGIGQRIALMSIHLGEMRKHANEPKLLESGIEDLSTRLQLLGSDVRRISHELHSTKLKHLGIEAALGGLCREITATRGINVEFTAEHLPRDLDNELSICFYRVAQEALQNVVKHGKALNVKVRLAVENDEMVLKVSDDGIGFDLESVRSKGTLGLVSIGERMRAVAGSANISSTPGNGTTVDARAPMRDAKSIK